MSNRFPFQVWATQGGGLVRWEDGPGTDGCYIFVEAPDCPGLTVGDEMPPEWGLIPANKMARTEY